MLQGCQRDAVAVCCSDLDARCQYVAVMSVWYCESQVDPGITTAELLLYELGAKDFDFPTSRVKKSADHLV